MCHEANKSKASQLITTHICVVMVLLGHTLYASLLCLRLLNQQPSEQDITWAEDLV